MEFGRSTDKWTKSKDAKLNQIKNISVVDNARNEFEWKEKDWWRSRCEWRRWQGRCCTIHWECNNTSLIYRYRWKVNETDGFFSHIVNISRNCFYSRRGMRGSPAPSECIVCDVGDWEIDVETRRYFHGEWSVDRSVGYAIHLFAGFSSGITTHYLLKSSLTLDPVISHGPETLSFCQWTKNIYY